MKNIFVIIATTLCLAATAFSQSTEFTYQGTLKDGAMPANGNYDIEFALFDDAAAGIQVGTTQTRTNVTVAGGVFGVLLDFGDQFPGAPRFIEIRVRVAGGASYTALVPRQPLSSAPYAIKSKGADTAASATNALQLGGVPANQYLTTANAQTSFISNWNVPAIPQTANFAISGNGYANIFTASTQFNIGNQRAFIAASLEGNTIVGRSAGPAVLTGFGNSIFGNGAGGPAMNGSFNSYFGASAGNAGTTASHNAFFGYFSGDSNTTGTNNSFFGSRSGRLNVDGTGNSFFGHEAGQANTSGDTNSFFGHAAGKANTTGQNNSFFGASAGWANTTGSYNSFFGFIAGENTTIGAYNVFAGFASGNSNTEGSDNTFIGSFAGQSNTTGNGNAFVGRSAGIVNTTGANNSFFGNGAGVANVIGQQNTFVGRSAGAATTSGNNSFVGANSGLNNSTGSNNLFVGASAGLLTTSGHRNTFIGTSSGSTNTTGLDNTVIGYNAELGSGALSFATAVGSGSSAALSNSVYLGRPGGEDTVRIPGPLNVTETLTVAGTTTVNGNLVVASGGLAVFNSPVSLTSLSSAGGTTLCRNASNLISTCSSSLRYKTNIGGFVGGLDLVKRLKPITFDWKAGGMHDMGLGAEDVAAVEPLLVTYNKDGVVEGVKYDRIGVVLVNGMNEQQLQIERQQLRIDEYERKLDEQKRTIDLLLSTVCSLQPTAPVCKIENRLKK
jgi:hypothetical protein